jgi:hypothetical protein
MTAYVLGGDMFCKMTLAVGLTLGLPALTVAQNVSETTATSTGWFSDKGCAEPRVKRGQIGPNNPDCVKRCLDEGAVPVFISEQAKALFEVKDYPTVRDDVGYRVEVIGIVDEKAKTIAVTSVKRLEAVPIMCGRPVKKSTQQH